MTESPALRTALDEALSGLDRPRAVSLAIQALQDGSVSLPDLYDLLSGILIDLGSAWQTGTAEVWQEHAVTGIVRTIVEACVHEVEAAAPTDQPATVVLAAPSDEYHDLGLRMLTDRFTLRGWRAHFLGANVPVAQVLWAVRELSADAVVLSASTHFHRLQLREYATALTEAEPDLVIWVGGPAFAHEHRGWDDEQVLDPHGIPAAGAQ